VVVLTCVKTGGLIAAMSWLSTLCTRSASTGTPTKSRGSLGGEPSGFGSFTPATKAPPWVFARANTPRAKSLYVPASPCNRVSNSRRCRGSRQTRRRRFAAFRTVPCATSTLPSIQSGGVKVGVKRPRRATEASIITPLFAGLFKVARPGFEPGTP
jgi:hypothetical protein